MSPDPQRGAPLCTSCRPRVALALLVGAAALAPAPASGQGNGPVQVFLDCQIGCDFNHIRREVGFVAWVRDREDADVQALVTTEITGSGGRSYRIDYIGLRRFASIDEQLIFNSSPTDTDDERRDGLTRTLALGLVRYVARSGGAQRLRISQAAAAGAAAIDPAADPWNFWVFRINGDGTIEGEDRRKTYRVDGELSANRTTESLKLDFEVDGRYTHRTIEIDDSTESISTTDSYGVEGLAVWSIGRHWSIGGEFEFDHSTFRNLDWQLELGPGIEFNVFPYEESTRREFTFFYRVGVQHSNYIEETLFLRTAETRPVHQLRAILSAQEPWGAARGEVEWSQYLHDLDRHRLEVSGRFSFRVFRGLDFTVSGSIARVKDQLFLPRDEASEEEVLLRLRQLGTDFEYRTSFGLSYRFGSIFNNVVNTRF